MIAYMFYRIGKVVSNEPMLKLNKQMFNTHIILIITYYIFWTAYEIVYTLWMLDSNDKRGITDATLKTLSAVELIFNISSVFLNILLFYMIDKMS